MANPLACAIGSAACALACLASGVGGLIILVSGSGEGVALLVLAVVLALAAKALDRMKMRSLYGRQRGDALHEAACSDESCMERARQDAETYLASGRGAERQAPQGASRNS